MKVVGIGLLLLAVYVLLLFLLPIEVMTMAWACIAGWQLGEWGYQMSNWFVNRYWS